MVDGEWRRESLKAVNDREGHFIRSQTQFRDWIRTDGDATPEAGRFHLYVSYACPWAHRVLITRSLMGLTQVIGLSVVDAYMGPDGWSFSAKEEHNADPLFESEFLWQIYARAQSGYSGRVTVPVLWDKKSETIINNESSELIRMLARTFVPLSQHPFELYPESEQSAIDAMIEANYNTVNNGVYRCGFARTQSAYDLAAKQLFGRLEELERQLEQQRFLVGSHLSLADICLFTTLLRFDLVYHTHFKCNLNRLRDYANLWAFTRDIYQIDYVKQTCRFEHIKNHYYMSHTSLNPRGIVPAGPRIDFDEPAGRGDESPLKSK